MKIPVPLSRRENRSHVSTRRVLTINMLSGMLIALSVYLLGQTTLPDQLMDFWLRVLVVVKVLLLERRLITAPIIPAIFSLVVVVGLAAVVCTFVSSLRLAVLANLALAAGIIAVNLSGASPVPVPASAVFAVLLITTGLFLDQYRERLQLRRRAKLAADRQETGFAILRHITHSMNPTIRTALSPVLSVKEHLREQGRLDEVIARRRDGSDERIGDALDTAVVSLGQMRDILETTEDLFAGRIEEQDFVETDLEDLFEREIRPLFATARFSIETDFAAAGRIRLHLPSFVQAVKNLIRNAEVHGFPSWFPCGEESWVRFAARRTAREIVIDCRNNGIPFPAAFQAADFLAFGRKGKQSPGKGLGGAWVARFVELHGGTFEKVGNDPVHFRICLPRRGIL